MFVRTKRRIPLAAGLGAVLVAAATVPAVALGHDQGAPTATPIKHLVVIFQENVSFDHYFATYPNAANPAGEPRFAAAAGTPSVNGLSTPLLAPNNPNSAQPFRLDRDQALTCDQDHGYTAEQQALRRRADGQVRRDVRRGAAPARIRPRQRPGDGLLRRQHRHRAVELRAALRDERQLVRDQLRPSTPGALNLVSGQTHGSADGAAVPARTAR